MLTLLERDRFIFANQRRMLISLSPYFTTQTVTPETSAFMSVHNSTLTSNSVTVGAFGKNAVIEVYVNGVQANLVLGAAPAFALATIVPNWVDNSWVFVSVNVLSTSGNGGYLGLYIVEDPLTSVLLP